MLPENLFDEIVNLPLKKLKYIKHEERQEFATRVMEITFQGKGKYKECPHCKRKTKDRYDQELYPQGNIRHQVHFSYDIRLRLLKRRFYCHRCKKDFIELFNFIPEPKPNPWKDDKKK